MTSCRQYNTPARDRASPATGPRNRGRAPRRRHLTRPGPTTRE
ncbi:hypothetical protein ACFPM0_09530 [Pseudonocardia sulfidoxydans]